MPTQNVNLPDHQSQFVHDSVTHGRYKNASEVVRAGLRLLEQQEAENALKLETLRRIAQESFAALDRGESTTFTPDTLDDWFGQLDQDIRTPRNS